MKKGAVALFLEKLARHLALLACLAIVARASGWTDAGPTSIMVLIVLATATHWGGRALSGARREPRSR
ncbi:MULTISPECIES: hypothetical protein [Desulfococcus]|jgi:hypothetical protein|uniref:Uncharacterized protein n=1 Tax=Desulfococcus multivorans DSM 2059 TaxID=1121405 RepID=S7TXQ3_DESML|nr:hypothetical protein [Desulfococcus multivorans]AOY56846.1 uncharacterized protein Dmul_00700 [Desulfococcus multivorans]AQU99389.1 hypothetical protein B2D07_00355 [Desulfococcus multivorans]EPR41861.1 hypothetical protein dsmv_1860 [Desulfococcus multivorans DSM 2059]MDX9817925.1 hypothetical protein [Desulfococcus multivorans]SJZ93210.1 hypothetical protein SAMN02745446_02138 [Desulfococcus multivorans DSM 2059]